MIYRLLADSVVVLHAAFVVFVVLGALLVLRWRWLMWAHLPAATWGALIEFGNLRCPLTPLEKWFRARAGETSYEGGFIEHYLLPVLYPVGLTRRGQLALGVAVVAINLAIYGRLWLRRRRA